MKFLTVLLASVFAVSAFAADVKKEEVKPAAKPASAAASAPKTADKSASAVKKDDKKAAEPAKK